MSRVKPIVLYLLWLVGFLILTHYALQYAHEVRTHASATYQMTPLWWVERLIPFVTGLYAAVLFIRGWQYRPNWPLLICVCLPLVIISFYPPLVAALNVMQVHVQLPVWLVQIYDGNASGVAVLAGFTLLYGLFGGNGGKRSRR